MNYAEIQPIVTRIPADRQGARRHYGVHPYFTRRPYNVVRDYILRYSQEGDRVLDPFGGSGVTAIEAFLENRAGLHNDINPLANFIAQGVAGLADGNLNEYEQALFQVKETCFPKLDGLPHLDETALQELLAGLKLPPDVALPANSDVANYHELFAPKQLAALAILREAIDEIDSRPARQGLLLAWAATLSKLNRTFLSAEGRAESRGGSSIFSIYRYKIAKEPVELPAWETFQERARNVIRAKQEIDQAIRLKQQTGGWRGAFQLSAQDVEDLSSELESSVDYIFTDPPYGGHISYLDLSTLWNSWLGLLPDEETRAKELIVGGELDLGEDQYVSRLHRSIAACVRMLKPGRWLSVVFQHWNTAYFSAILKAAAESGADLKAAVSQIGDPIWSMHKKKNASVLAGEMILTFCKTGQAKKLNSGNHFSAPAFVNDLLAHSSPERVYGESLFNQLIIEAWRRSALDSLDISRDEFTEILENSGWQYDETRHCWFKTQRQPELLFY
jgi:hypothetical protein